jgi:hypothetical protein
MRPPRKLSFRETVEGLFSVMVSPHQSIGGSVIVDGGQATSVFLAEGSGFRTGCIDADFRDQILAGQRSTNSAQSSSPV